MTASGKPRAPKRYTKICWVEEFLSDSGHLCGLCQNHGYIDTRRRMTGGAGGLYYCVCPNGRAYKRVKVDLEIKAGYKTR